MNKFWVVLILLGSGSLFAQTKFKLSLESGYLNTDIEKAQKVNEILSRIDLKLQYRFKSFSTKVKVQPGFLGSLFKTKSLKYKGEINYIDRTTTINYGAGISFQRNNYYESNTHKLNIASFNLFGNFILQEKLSFDTRINYNVQETEFYDTQILKRLNASLSLSYYYDRYTHLNVGIYGEKFFIHSESNASFGSRNKNNGYRVGPIFSMNYSRAFIFRLSYKYLYQETEVFDEASSEHNLRLVTGVLLNKYWSLFALVDYTQPVYDFELKNYNDKNLLYISSNYENNYYLKLAYKVSKKFSVYTKAGYFNESIKYLNYDFKGWNCMLGVEIK